MAERRFTLAQRFMASKVRAIYESRRIPLPPSNDPVSTPGSDPDRILLVGNGLLAGMGVDRHDQAVAGHLSRELAHHTGRPTKVSLLVDIRLRCADMPAFIAAYDFSGFDAVVVLTGGSDAIQLLPEDDWRRQEASLLAALDVRVPPTVDILVVGINPPSSIPALGLTPGGRADLRADAFNRITSRLTRKRFRYVAPPLVDSVGPVLHHPGAEETEHRQVSEGYRAWAREIAAHLEYVRSHNPTWNSQPA